MSPWFDQMEFLILGAVVALYGLVFISVITSGLLFDIHRKLK